MQVHHCLTHSNYPETLNASSSLPDTL